MKIDHSDLLDNVSPILNLVLLRINDPDENLSNEMLKLFRFFAIIYTPKNQMPFMNVKNNICQNISQFILNAMKAKNRKELGFLARAIAKNIEYFVQFEQRSIIYEPLCQATGDEIRDFDSICGEFGLQL